MLPSSSGPQRLAMLGLLLALYAAVVQAWQSCLPDAVPLERRRNLTSNGTSIPLGIWNGQAKWQTATPTAAFQILAEEYLGYNVRVEVSNTGVAQHVLYALAGCMEPTADADRGCGGQETHFHAAIGVYLNQEVAPHLQDVQRMQMGGVLDDLSSLGFPSQSGIYVDGLTQNMAEVRERLFLDDYRSYNAKYENPKQWFSNRESINTSKLIPCRHWVGTFGDGGPENFLQYTDDGDGIDFVEGRFVPSCADGYWWLAQKCRSRPQDCVPCVTGSASGYVYGAEEIMFKANMWNMSLALAATDGHAAGTTFEELITGYRVLFYFWEPDLTFRWLRQQLISFPEFNEQQWNLGSQATMAQALDLRILANQNLDVLAPDARDLMINMQISTAEVLQMMHGSTEAVKQIQAALNTTALAPEEWWGACWQGACDWLQQNRDVWQGWMTLRSNCYAGQGMQEGGRWLTSRRLNATCSACEPGRYSQLLEDEYGATAICSPCQPGYSQPKSLSVRCEPCSPGYKADQWGATRCEKCPQGQYQEAAGATQCWSCIEGETTTVLAADSAADCTCQPGRYLYAESEEEGFSRCRECPEGMECPGGSRTPYQLEGFWAQAVSSGSGMSYSVFSCRDGARCPAGLPGRCSSGRMGRACADCLRGYASHVDGSCRPCDALSLWPFLLLPILILGLLPLLVAATILVSRARRVAVSIFIVCVIFGQLVVCLQSLEAIYQFEISWIDPAKAVLSSLAIFSLDIEFSCILEPQSHVVEYGSQLLAYPVVLVATFGFWLLARAVNRPISFNSFVNLHGVLVVALLTAMSLTVMRPFQCRSNPNGLTTMSTRTDVICWSEEHAPLVVLACMGILCYPVAILGTIAFLTWKYPIWLRSGGGLEVLEKYKFLFGRFRPERYYYALLLCAHNLVVATIPAALVSVPALQVGIMGIVICVKLAAQSLLWPWRIDVANYNDLVLSTALLILLLLASPLLRLDPTDSTFLVAVLLSCVLCVLPLAALCAAGLAASFRLRPQSKYDAFLCHHKAGAGALCRFFKLIVHKYGRMNIFLDSDELDDLARIFEIVSCDTRCLVAVLTPELLQRMWCAGEMTSARKHGIPIVPLYCDGFTFPDAESINNIQSVWTEEQQYTLTSHGISMEDIKAAYRHISTLEGHALCRQMALQEQERLILDVASAATRGLRRAEVAPQGSVSSARILLCSTELEPEAISTALILQQMVQQQLRIATFRARSSKDITAAASASFALVLLSKGVLEDPDFALRIAQMRAQGLGFVPVNDGTFQFPSPDFYMQVEENGVAGLGPNLGRGLAKAYQALLGILALPLTPHASTGILERQVAQICRRFGSLDDLLEQRTVSTNRTTTADEVGVADISMSLAVDTSMSLAGFEDMDVDLKATHDQERSDERESEYSFRDDLWYT